MIGKKFNRLTVLSLVKRKKSYRVKCVCDCGGTTITCGNQVLIGKIKSCGCYRDEIIRTIGKKHGMSIGNPEYMCWAAIKERCLNPNSKKYPDYGGRGITVCNRWLKFEDFFSDMGRRPGPKFSIERIDNNDGYHPKNCKWATQVEQNKNTRVSVFVIFQGKRVHLSIAAAAIGVTSGRLRQRMRRGVSQEFLFSPNRLENNQGLAVEGRQIVPGITSEVVGRVK